MSPHSSIVSTVRSACASCLSRISWKQAGIVTLITLLIGGYCLAFAPPSGFSPGSMVRVARGTPVPEIAAELATAHIIRHPSILRALLRVSGESGNVKPGVYQFTAPQNVFIIAYRLVAGAYGLPPVRITFIEGTTVREAAVHVASAMPDITADDFLAAAEGKEGYLFPDTYFFQPSDDAASIVAAMRANFDTKIAPIVPAIGASGHSLADIVTMASIVEKEARTSADRRMVAGILWNRIKLGMPLQVDAVFGYIFDRATYSPSPADLKVASPYNTYLHAGLPPGPIDNPGLDSLQAAAQPTKTSYLYYLTGRDGLMHYATTYAGHQANLRKYLN